MNIMMLLEMASGGLGDRPAVGTHDHHLTYQQLFDRAGSAASMFRSAGVDHVGMIDTASWALPVSLFGAAWAGLPFVPMNYRLDDEGLRHLVERISPSLTIVNEDTALRVDGIDGCRECHRDELLAELEHRGPLDDPWDMDPEQVAILLFTSGTTGMPKAAVLRHKNLVSYILGSVEFAAAGEDEANLISVPPYHIAGMAAILSSIFAGRRIVQLPSFHADTWIEVANREQVTHAMVVPTMLARIVERMDATGAEPIPSLRALSYGGGKMPQPVIERALELFPEANFVNAYGLTETSSTIALLGPDEHREAAASDDPLVRRRLSSVGRPLPTVEVTIRDEEGAEVPAGAEGEVWVRGEQVAGEYVGIGSRLTEDGWFPTHDGGWMDDEGYLFVTGRMDDIIIRGGENISPGEIEDVLIQHPNVADCAAVGVADAQWGEVIAVAVVRAEDTEVTEDELHDLVKVHLRSSRTPDHVVFVDELPYNETGKLLRRVLRTELAELGDHSID